MAENPTAFERPYGWRRLRRLIRNVLFLVVVPMVVVDDVGEPLVRWNYRYEGNRQQVVYLDATYIGLSGSRKVYADQFGKGCPLVLFIKPETPLWRRMADKTTTWITPYFN